MNKIAKVSSYRTTDGQLFCNEKDASTHQDSINYRQAIEKIVYKIYFDNMSSIDIVDGFLEHKNELVEAING